ncbi:MAG: SCO family protein [Xanthomonadales bacterium]|nr:SCO family protein [Xanthomonadales bacterium]
MDISHPTPRPARQSGSAKHPFLIILAIALTAGLGFWLSQQHFSGDASDSHDPGSLQTVRLFPSPLPLQAFELKGPNGSLITPEQFKGRWAMIFFGFTHCPDICPTTLARLAEAARLWDKELDASQRPAVLFVSVDPERDSPKRTTEYATYFDKAFLGGTNDDTVLQPMARSMGMVFAKEPLDTGIEGDYEVQHSASIVLIDPQGRRAGLIRPPLDPAAIAADMVALTQSTTSK